MAIVQICGFMRAALTDGAAAARAGSGLRRCVSLYSCTRSAEARAANVTARRLQVWRVDLISTLGSSQVHLWLAFYDEIRDRRLHCAYRELLSAGEREQERRFYFSRDRRRYLVTRALIRTVLSRYAPIDAKDWLFSTNPYGRPEIANLAAQDLHVSFNVSHTHGLIVLAVTVHRALGVDVENTRTREVSLDIADRFFAPAEVAALSTVRQNQQQNRFFEYWTFKESYIKARGMGLALPLDKFSFHFPNDRSVRMSIHPGLADDPKRWQLWLFRPASDYLVAMCAERLSSGSADVVIRKVVPMTSEATIVLEPLKTSERPRGGREETIDAATFAPRGID